VPERVRLGIDLAELPSEPEELYLHAHLAYLAGGGHAGDHAAVSLACARCRAHGVLVGAHPGYADRARFGRVELAMPLSELRESVRGQCALVREHAEREGLAVQVLKLHGALYHAADRDPAIAAAALDGATDALGTALTVVGLDGRWTLALAKDRGLRALREGFADRRARSDGTLVPRDEPGALLLDPTHVHDRALALARSGATDVLCVHGDSPGAAQLAAAARAAIDELEAGRW
jgi:UPF0271 protein